MVAGRECSLRTRTAPGSANRLKGRLAIALTALLAASGLILVTPRAEAGSPVTISTIDQWSGEFVRPFGAHPEATSTYGQTLRVPTGHPQLHTLTFWMQAPTWVQFRGYVFAWDDDADRATGPMQWAGVTRSTTSEQWQRVTLRVNTRLRPGQRYVVFLSTLGIDQPHSFTDYGVMGLTAPPNSYRAGAMVYFNAANRRLWTSDTWDGGDAAVNGPGGDLAFTATFIR
jgi:hypothetical protein